MNLRSPLKHAHDLLRWSEKYTQTDMVYLAKGGFWLVAGQFGAALLAFVFSIVIANYLSPYLYGSYKYVMSVVSIIGAFSLTGLGTTIIRKVAQGDEGALKRGFDRSLFWSLPMVLAFIAVAGYYAYQGDFVLSLAIFVAGLATPLINSASLFNAYWNGKKDFARQTIYWSIPNTLATVGVIVALFLTDHIAILLSVFFIISAVGNLFLYFQTVKHIPADTRKDDAFESKDAFHQSIINFLNTIASNIDKIIVFHLLGTVQLAIYSFALAMPEQIRNTLKAGARLALPRYAEQSFSQIQKFIGPKMFRFSLLILCMMAVYCLIAPFMFTYLFPAYHDSIPYSQVIALSLVGIIGTAPLSALQAHAKHRSLYIHAIVSNIIQIGSSIILTLSFGLWGAVIALVGNRLLGMVLPWLLLRQEKSEPPH